MAKRKKWRYTAGKRPYRVRVYERKPGGMLYAAAWDPGESREVRRSLGHTDHDAAESYAIEEAAKLREGMDRVRTARPTARRIFGQYEAHRTPNKRGEKARKEDRRQCEMWRRFLGPDFDLSRLGRREWEGFTRKRASGEIDARGRPIANPDDRTPVRDRMVEKDLLFLRTVVGWACEWRDADGRLLMENDPTRGLDSPHEKNPSRYVATHDRVDAIRNVYRNVTMRVMRGGKRREVESYLPEVFEIGIGTGRRIGAVVRLCVEDLDLAETEAAPWGAIVWPQDTDKMGKCWRCPISPKVREVLEGAIRKRQRLGHVGRGYLFPGPFDPESHVRYEAVRDWLRAAEVEAKLEPVKGHVFHAYRRLWASARKDLPDIDVAQAGGWSSLQALKSAYQQPDERTMLKVVTHDAELREVR
jgi:integrase